MLRSNFIFSMEVKARWVKSRSKDLHSVSMTQSLTVFMGDSTSVAICATSVAICATSVAICGTSVAICGTSVAICATSVAICATSVCAWMTSRG